MPHRSLVRLAVGAAVLLPTCGVLTGTAGAAVGPSSPPPGSAEAYALLVSPLLAVGHSGATAGNGSGSATGNGLEVGGKPLIDGSTGGSQQGNGSKKGSLLDTGVTPLGQLQVTPWSAAVTQNGSSTSADGDAALLRLFLLDPTVFRAAVLQSHSHAESDGSGSSSSSSSDGADVNAGNGALHVTVLHAESSSGKGGSSYLVGINGNTVGNSSDAKGSCAVNVPSVAALSCLTATGGPGAQTAGSSVGEVTLGSGQVKGTVVGTRSSGARAVAQGSGSTTATGSSPGTTSGSSAGSTEGASGLPFTGSPVGPLAAIGAFALAAGAWVQQASRMRPVRVR